MNRIIRKLFKKSKGVEKAVDKAVSGLDDDNKIKSASNFFILFIYYFYCTPTPAGCFT